MGTLETSVLRLSWHACCLQHSLHTFVPYSVDSCGTLVSRAPPAFSFEFFPMKLALHGLNLNGIACVIAQSTGNLSVLPTGLVALTGIVQIADFESACSIFFEYHQRQSLQGTLRFHALSEANPPRNWLVVDSLELYACVLLCHLLSQLVSGYWQC